MATITKNELIAAGYELKAWNDRFYIVIPGKCVSKLWLGNDGKVRFENGKGINNTESNEFIETFLGCEITSRYSSKDIKPFITL
jgi:hypothetical protein